MSKKSHLFFVKYISRPWFMVVFCVVIYAVLHTALFGIHTFIVFRYESLYEQIRNNGATIQMSTDFLRTQSVARNRTLFSRPDILAQEIGVIQSGTRFMIHQYKNDMYRLRDRIVQHIKYLFLAAEIGEELVYPGQDRSLHNAFMLQTQLDAVAPGDINTLRALSELSANLVKTTQYHIDYAQRKLILQDILAFKHEMLLLTDMYRLNPPREKILDTKGFWNDFRTAFSRDKLLVDSYETLKNTLDRFRGDTQSYRDNATLFRAKSRERRAAWVETEKKKWSDTSLPPVSPLPDVYQLIYVSLAQQKMYVYEDNELILSTAITSGRNNYETIRGQFRIYTKQRGKIMKSPFPDEEYELWVDYWMGFSGAYGIHDACNSTDCWRTKFGGASYIYNGSHGCINTPYNAVKFVYNWAKVGTTVYVR